ncbi:ArsR family transcriptional regulator [Bacteriovorax sp. PP10]|uniref:ArsR family transcriptional regulator n=1 Tax=Bacteriovorax antarcticus TaxID=3088717 RepID=A0ABU5VZZ1_9BACT|nr:ArsR family transcriptional regulator [Bacteriovorax sp. PP10]MEA9357575.1 ArsR family transcriptional regulator [Bacteriovorax sp. PP10]
MDKLQLLKKQQGSIFESMAGILSAIAAPVRIRLIHFLSQAPLTVEVLAAKTDQSVANTSMHLRKMLNEGLVNVESMGQKRLYTLEPAVLDFWESYQDFIQKLDPTLKINSQELGGDISWTEDWEETRKLIKKQEIIFLDVRPNDEVTDEKEFPSIVHISQQDLKQNLSKLPKRKKILVFCRGRMCALSAYSVNYLRENGYKAYRLEESWTRLKKELLK